MKAIELQTNEPKIKELCAALYITTQILSVTIIALKKAGENKQGESELLDTRENVIGDGMASVEETMKKAEIRLDDNQQRLMKKLEETMETVDLNNWDTYSYQKRTYKLEN